MTLESPIFGSPLDDLVPKMTFLSSGKEGAIKGATGIHIPYLFPIQWGAGQGATNGVSQPSYSFATSASFGHENNVESPGPQNRSVGAHDSHNYGL